MAKQSIHHEWGKALELLGRIYELHRDKVDVSPSWMATEAMQELDPDRVSHPLEYLLAHLQLRQIARSLCAGRWQKDEGRDDEQHELFPGLQRRYPIADRINGEEPVYRRLEDLTADDVAYNVHRLRSEARSKLAHADRLDAWGRERPAGLAA